MNNNIKTILFDLDGTLIDTNELIIASFLHTLDEYFPNEYKREDVIPFMGPSLRETFEQLNPRAVDEMIDTYRAYNIAHHDNLVTEFSGVYTTVEKLAKENYQMAIVTTKKHDVALKGLQLMNLQPFFSNIVAYDDVEKTKPDPEPIYKALHFLKSKPEEAIMIGDNYHDIVAGKNAGTKTAGVAWSLKGKDFLEQYKPDYMLETMEDILSIVGVNQK